MTRKQSVRISQMVLTWGPGSILESREGPRMILRDGLQLPPGVSLDHLRLSSPELETLLTRLPGVPSSSSVRIFQVPGAGTVDAYWRTKPFPEWHLCVTHQILYKDRCPECEEKSIPRWCRRKEAIRFVRACPGGHLDDVDWDRLVHRGNLSHPPGYYIWKSRGPGLSDVFIICPQCGRQRSLGEAYRESWPCSGRFPERERPDQPPQRPGCPEQSYILQRQASNLRVPEIVSLLTVPPLFTAARQVLGKLVGQLGPETAKTLLIGQDGSLQRKSLDSLVKDGKITPSERDEILGCPDPEIIQALNDVLGYSSPQDLTSLLSREFQAFLEGTREGIPPIRSPGPGSRVLLEVKPGMIRHFLPFLVVPVSRLRLVTVQIGYRRNVGPVAEANRWPALVETSVSDSDGNIWFPGYESVGEGLFITLEGTESGRAQIFTGVATENWMKAYHNPGAYEQGLFRDPRYRAELHPCFVAWHTLSHLLIRALAVDSGYSSPSIRERIYLEKAPDGQMRGGILIYTATRGGDGSLGGLLVMANNFDRILNRVREMTGSCSADPLCQEHSFEPGKKVLGAACHACALISETSCEHRNHWLDRNVLAETGWLE